jgi:uncharacterized spore protein YtfJ
MSEPTIERAAPTIDDAGYSVLAEGFSRLDTVARAESTMGPARRVGERTLIPLAEVWYGGGFGLGRGSSAEGDAAAEQGMGGGGGFGGHVRPVAVVEVGPTGMRVRPVFDATTVGLVLATAALSTLVQLWRQRARRR